ncbi:hypothetical protein BS47DRAFT_1397342 [Hydnum rufescens UP504]|uniref:Uncharacterized protein n=1 Tax=Hydnum rufescens UP504 TaxID=1448309 RepID=A0A9P6AN82_9AGAM|nr:hypothetical protein BS47DRAFT_1397342 [Hydnum rufescens UP504]
MSDGEDPQGDLFHFSLRELVQICDPLFRPRLNIVDSSWIGLITILLTADGGGYNDDDEDEDDGESSVELGGEPDEDTRRHTSNNRRATQDLDRHLSDSTDNREADCRTLATLDKYRKIYDWVAAKNPKAKAATTSNIRKPKQQKTMPPVDHPIDQSKRDDDEQVFSITVECPTLDGEACTITVDSEITWDAFLMRVAEAMGQSVKRVSVRYLLSSDDKNQRPQSLKDSESLGAMIHIL